MVEKTNLNCALIGGKLCGFLGCDGCEKCVFKGGLDRRSNSEEMEKSWNVTLSYIPKSMDELHESDTCQLCGERHKDVYGILSLGHPEPEYKKGMFFGFGKKVRTQIGSLIDAPIGVCSSCRRKILMKDIIQLGGGLLIAVLAVVLMLIPGIQSALEKISWAMPFLVFVGIIAIGWAAVYFLGDLYLKKQAGHITVNPLELPQIKTAVANGWFPVPDAKKGVARMTFSKKKPRENFRFFEPGDETVTQTYIPEDPSQN